MLCISGLQSVVMYFAACSFFLALTAAQAFSEYPVRSEQESVSQDCVVALNTTVECSGILPMNAEELPRLAQQDLTTLCKASCLNSLRSARQIIAAACNLTTDVVTVYDTIYPATYLIDYLTYAYNVFCLVDSATGQYCDVVQAEWAAQKSPKPEQACSDCMLSQIQMQLNSPFGYDEDTAEDFVSATSSCSKTNYAFTSPPAYTPTGTTVIGIDPSSTADSDISLPPSCVTLYQITAQDTCNSIALSQRVSTFSVYGPNGIKCDALPVGSNICLLGQCDQHQVAQNDTCDSIIAASGKSIDPQLFVAWNPDINPLCNNLGVLVGNYICLSRPDGILNPNITIPTSMQTPPPTQWPNRTIPDEVQLPTALGTITGCKIYRNYKEVSAAIDQPAFFSYDFGTSSIANDCNFVASMYGIELADFLSWNPSLRMDSPCTLKPGYSYCIKETDTITPEDDRTLPCMDIDASEIQPGTTKLCTCYTHFPGNYAGQWGCSDAAVEYGVTIDNLKSWNTWLGSDCDASLFNNLDDLTYRALCVGINGANGTTTPVSTEVTKTSISTSATRISSSATFTTFTTTTSSSSSSVPSPSGSVCVKGIGDGNHLGLCDYACGYGYCPSPVCTCLAYGTQVPPPTATWPVGYPIAGEDDSYLGLCSFACNHGYCPTDVCTTTKP